jgi:hypothetical protein
MSFSRDEKGKSCGADGGPVKRAAVGREKKGDFRLRSALSFGCRADGSLDSSSVRGLLSGAPSGQRKNRIFERVCVPLKERVARLIFDSLVLD